MRTYENHADSISFHITENPVSPEKTDCYAVEAKRVAELTRPENTHPTHRPVIAYGTQAQLRRAFLDGCSDFLKEPWSPEELHFRVLRQSNGSVYDFPWGALELRERRLIVRPRTTNDGTLPLLHCSLPEPEYRILEILLEQRGTIVSRDALYYAIWDKPGAGSRTVDVHISRLRRALAAVVDPAVSKTIIKTVYGRGYLVDNLVDGRTLAEECSRFDEAISPKKRMDTNTC